MRHLLAGLLVLMVFAPRLAAQEADARVHEVREGDTLWDLARQYLGDPFLWPEIFRANRDSVANPDRIFPRERLRIPTLADRTAPAEVPPVVAAARPGPPERSVFFDAAEPEERGPTLRLAPREEVSAVLAGDFYRAGLLVPQSEVVPLGELVELLNPSRVPMQIPAQIGLYDRVFLSLSEPGSVRVGDRVQLIRPGRRVEPYGRIFTSTGMAAVVAVDGAVATVEVRELFAAMALGDLAVAVVAAPSLVGAEPQPVAGVEGTLVAFETPHVLQSPQDRGFLDLGRQSGVGPGDEFLVYLPPEREEWGVRPEVPVARLQVVRVTDRTAAVRVVSLEQPALEAGLPVRQIGKIP